MKTQTKEQEVKTEEKKKLGGNVNPTTLTQIWALKRPDGGLVPPIEDSGNPFLAFENEADAARSARHHAEWYEVDCSPVRLK